MSDPSSSQDLFDAPELVGIRKRWTLVPKAAKIAGKLIPVLYTLGIIGLLIVPYPKLARRTYIDENALLPGQARTHYNSFDAQIADEIAQGFDMSPNAKYVDFMFVDLENSNVNHLKARLCEQLDCTTQNFNYTKQSGRVIHGQNLIAVARAPRGDGTEVLMITTPLKCSDGSFNHVGASFAASFALSVKRWSFWAKDVMFLFADYDMIGAQAWLEAYSGMDSTSMLQSESIDLQSGVIGQAFNLQFCGSSNNFDLLGIYFESTNGQLPNQDIVNAVDWVGRMEGVPMDLHTPRPGTVWKDRRADPFRFDYATEEVLDGMRLQVSGYPIGIHSLFPRFKIDAISLHPIRANPYSGSSGLAQLGAVMEGCLRTTNNLLERLHHSYFFYIFTSPDLFISLSLYLPILCLLLGSLLMSGLNLWWTLGDEVDVNFALRPMPGVAKANPDQIATVITSGIPFEVAERDVIYPMIVLFACMVASVFVYVTGQIFNGILTSRGMFWFVPIVTLTTIIGGATSVIQLLQPLKSKESEEKQRQWMILKCFMSLIMPPILFAMSTLNFSLALATTLLLVPTLLLIRGGDAGKVKRMVLVSLIFVQLPFWVMQIGSRAKPTSPLTAGMLRSFAIMQESWQTYGSWLLPWLCLVYLPSWYYALVISSS